MFTYTRLPPGTYIAYGMRTATVRRPVRILRVEALSHSPNVDFVSAYVSFFACASCRPRPRTFGSKILLGSTCGTTDLHSRAAQPAAGVDLYPGDAPNFIVVGRTRDGTGSIAGARVTFSAGGRARTVTSEYHGVEIDDDGTPPRSQCPNPKTEMWFGGTDEQRWVRLLAERE